jgi:uncharacterized protein (TIGR03118 family)
MPDLFKRVIAKRGIAAAVFVFVAVVMTVLPVASHAFYIKKNLRATDAAYCADEVDPDIKNAWGIAIRPAGLGGHFWVTGNGTGKSVQYVGDVGGKPLFQDALKLVDVPGPLATPGTPTGVVFNASTRFVVTNDHPSGAITAAAKFIFATDNGVVSAWTERKRADGGTDWPAKATAVIDGSAKGEQYFGVGATADGSKLLVADFGLSPQLRVYDAAFKEITSTDTFVNPFITDGVAKPGDYVPFNVQVLVVNGAERVFVAYAKSQDDPATPEVDFLAGEEDAGAGKGRLAEFDTSGQLMAKWDDKRLLNAPWGLAVAPADFASFSGYLLVSNFGDGTIVAFNPATRRAVDYVRDPYFLPIKTDGIWGLQFGNGASLGEANHVYFAAGPEDEEAGVFGKIQPLNFSRRSDIDLLSKWYRDHTICFARNGNSYDIRTCSRKPECSRE